MISQIKKTMAELPSFKKVIVGVSGGADSVALAHLMIILGYDVTIAHLNHGLRGGESDTDEMFVDSLSKKWKVPFVTKKVRLSDEGNLENNARLARYLFLEKVRQEKKAKFIATAHHLDDQIETILLHMKRGAGWRGLSGMRIQNNQIIRPLLNIKKTLILDYLSKNKINYRTDESNFDVTFARNQIRHEVIPKLKKKWKRLEDDLIRLSLCAQSKIDFLDKKAKQWILKNVTDASFERSAFLKEPEDIQAEILFQICGHQDIYCSSVEKVQHLIFKGKTGKWKSINQYTFEVEYQRIKFYIGFSKSEPLPKVTLNVQSIRWGDYELKYSGDKSLYARSWQPGDRFQPTGMDGSKKLQDFFIDKKIPRSKRHQIPIIVNSDNQIVCVGDLRLDKRFIDVSYKLKVTTL